MFLCHTLNFLLLFFELSLEQQVLDADASGVIIFLGRWVLLVADTHHHALVFLRGLRLMVVVSHGGKREVVPVLRVILDVLIGLCDWNWLRIVVLW